MKSMCRSIFILCVTLTLTASRRPRLPHVTEVEVQQQDDGRVGFRVGKMEALGFHGDWYLLKAVDVIARNVKTFIETGTHSASTLHYIARTYPSMSTIYSCEPLQEWYDISKKKHGKCASCRFVLEFQSKDLERHVTENDEGYLENESQHCEFGRIVLAGCSRTRSF